MKRSELKQSIQSEIIDILEAEAVKVTPEDVKTAKAYNVELAKTAELAKSMKTEGNDQDDGYVNHTYNDSVIDKYNVPVEPTAVFEEDEFKSDDKYWADYQDIGIFYLDGFNKKHSLTDDQLEILGKKIVDRLYKGDIGKAYDAVVNRDKLDIPGKPAFVKEDRKRAAEKTKDRLANRKSMADFDRSEKEFKDVDDKEPTSSQLKGDSVSMLAIKLQQVTKEMKQIVKKWKDAEGSEKDKLTDELRTKTKIKKELESLLENKK